MLGIMLGSRDTMMNKIDSEYPSVMEKTFNK